MSNNVINAQMLFNRVRMWLAGIQFNGARDLYQQFGYRRMPDFRDFIAIYYRHAIAKRVIDAPVLATWSDPPQLSDTPEFNSAWKEIVETQKLWHNVIRLDKLAGLGAYAVMVVGYDDGQPLDQPITARSGQNRPRKVIYLQPYHVGALSILSYNTDQTSPRFNKPEMYHINPGRFLVAGITSTLTQGMNAAELRRPFNCHHSRLIHVAEELLEDGIFGTSRLEVVFNDVNDIMKVTGASAELFWITANRGMQLDVDKDMELGPEEMKELNQEVEDYHHQIRRFIRTRGVKIENLGSEVADPKNVFAILIQMISIATGIPQAILTGNEEGRIASAQDRSNWADRVAERVASYANPVVLKAILDNLINAGALPNPVNLQTNWPEAFKMGPLERAQTSAQMARSATNLMKGHVAALSATDNEGNALNATPLFSTDEMRRIVSFGRHPPVFDSPQPSGDVPSIGTPDSTATSGSVAATGT